MEFFQAGINKKKPNRNRRRVERNTQNHLVFQN